MKYLFSSLPEIEKKLKSKKGCLLMLDFDGTLSPLVSTPGRASLPKKHRQILTKAAAILPAAIITGRGLLEIKEKVKVKNLSFAGNHGLEWEIGGKKSLAPVPQKQLAALKAFSPRLKTLAKKYPGVIIQDKSLSLTVHYRIIKYPRHISRLKKEVLDTVKKTAGAGTLAVFEGKKVVEIRPKISWNKGNAAKLLLAHEEKKHKTRMLPIYIGDDTTDEAAFLAVKKGLAIRVGKTQRSHADYFLTSTDEVGTFISYLINLKNKKI